MREDEPPLLLWVEDGAPIDGKEMNENVKRNSGFMGYLEGLGKSFVRRKTDALLDKLMNEEK